jgi:pimeloyl-ACP methyl ester carboxylesterase
MYIFDYGAPVGLRLALQRPDVIKSIATQNGNAYVEGFGDVWAPIKGFWVSNNLPEDRHKVEIAMLTLEAVQYQYENGTPNVSRIAPESK